MQACFTIIHWVWLNYDKLLNQQRDITKMLVTNANLYTYKL